MDQNSGELQGCFGASDFAQVFLRAVKKPALFEARLACHSYPLPTAVPSSSWTGIGRCGGKVAGGLRRDLRRERKEKKS
jgi:hypothetical protein